MNFELPPLGATGRVTPPQTSQPGAGRVAGGFGAALSAASAVKVDTIPASPPPDLIHQMEVAAGVADKLRAQERELHFEPTKSGRVVVQVRDLDGNVIRTIPPARALEIASGQPLD